MNTTSTTQSKIGNHAGNAPSHVLRVLIVDDEHLARMRLERLLTDAQLPPEAPCMHIVGSAESAMQALEMAKTAQADVMLMDIHMPGMDGMELAREMRKRHPKCQLVFVTAHSEHAVHAFEVDATDYLTKPVRKERLQSALLKVIAQHALQQGGAASAQNASAQSSSSMPANESILIQSTGRSHRLPLTEILYARAENKYIIFYTTRQHEWVWDGSLALLEEKYPQFFIRIHRNTLVQRNAIRQIKHCFQADGSEGWKLQLNGSDEWLPVSRRQLPSVRQCIQSL